MSTHWEQEAISTNIPVIETIMPLGDATEAVLQLRGDEHAGLRGFDKELYKVVCLREQEKYKKRLIVLLVGDAIENSSKRSIGHGYDLLEPDPAKQIGTMQEVYKELSKNLYNSKWKNMKRVTMDNGEHARIFGVIGNHEYRSRKDSGIWLNDQIYEDKGIVNAGIRCIIRLILTKKKPKMEKIYNIYLSHRLTNSAAGVSHATLLKNFKKTKGDIVGADIYACGHYHTHYIDYDVKFTSDGKREKVMYIVNPSPLNYVEYSDWALYSPNFSGIGTNIYLPIDRNMYGII